MTITEVTEKHKKIRINPFGYDVHIIVTSNFDYSLDKRNLPRSRDFEGYALGLHHKTSVYDTYCHLLFKYNATMDIIIHESFHAVWNLMKCIGAEPEEEVIAYTLDHIATEVAKFVTKVGDLPKPTSKEKLLELAGKIDPSKDKQILKLDKEPKSVV